MDMRSPYAASFPLTAPADAHWTDTVVKQGHVDYCAAHGHATWTDDGVDMGRCPRCGAVTAATVAPAAAAAPTALAQQVNARLDAAIAAAAADTARRAAHVYGSPERAADDAAIVAERASRAAARAAERAAAALNAEADTYVSPAAMAAPAACTHWECALMGDTCTVTGAPAMMPPRRPRTYTARRIAAQYYEYTGADEFTPGEDFNVDATPYAVDDDAREFDSVADMVAAIRRDGVEFAAYGDGSTACDPDGSHDIDYATGARESVSWHLDTVSPALLARVIIPAVDAR